MTPLIKHIKKALIDHDLTLETFATRYEAPLWELQAILRGDRKIDLPLTHLLETTLLRPLSAPKVFKLAEEHNNLIPLKRTIRKQFSLPYQDPDKTKFFISLHQVYTTLTPNDYQTLQETLDTITLFD